jgi:hypothetical protein
MTIRPRGGHRFVSFDEHEDRLLGSSIAPPLTVPEITGTSGWAACDANLKLDNLLKMPTVIQASNVRDASTCVNDLIQGFEF